MRRNYDEMVESRKVELNQSAVLERELKEARDRIHQLETLPITAMPDLVEVRDNVLKAFKAERKRQETKARFAELLDSFIAELIKNHDQIIKTPD